MDQEEFVEIEVHKAAKRLFSIYKARARKRKITFSLELDEFEKLVFCGCEYCGEYGSNVLNYRGFATSYNGIDRIDSEKGYESGNVVSCCSFCNSFKGAMVPEHWFDFLNCVIYSHSHNVEPAFPEYPADESRKSKRYFRGY
jgi:hypothetical protein